MDTIAACAHIETHGYCLIQGLLDPSEATRLDALARPLMTHATGYVKLEGALDPIPDLAPLCIHPVVMEIAAHFLGSPFYLANNACMMWCQPGSPAGGQHADWPLGDVPQPYPVWPMLLQTMWMITDFTEDNGATRMVPGSHLSGRPPGSGDDGRESAMAGPRGSVLIWHGGIWHRNGANVSTHQQRMGANVAYIPRFVHRPQDGWPLVRRELYQRFPARLQALLERSVA